MEDIHNLSEYDLEKLSYRGLQQIAKGMSLPSNVKKLYLVQLIYAKTHKTAVEVAEIVQRVKYERKMLSQTKNKRKGKQKMHLQAMEVSSSNACMSPPINLTPKRAYSPEMLNYQPIIKYHPRPDSPKITSDRVLRSYNIRSYKRPNYSLINNPVVELERASSPKKEKETQISIVSHDGRHPRFNVTARCVVKKMRPLAPHPRPLPPPRADSFTSVTTQTQTTSTALVPPKRMRTLSGFTPIMPEPRVQYNYEFIKSIGFRREDGKLSKINALVQKPAPKVICNIDLDSIETEAIYRNVEVTIQDIINSNIDCQTFTNPNVSEYTFTESNMAHNVPAPLTDVMPLNMVQNTDETNSFSVYYHKKIRPEQKLMPVSVPYNMANERRLSPNISDVFSQIGAVCDVTRPYMAVKDDKLPSYQALRGNNVLENIYNIKTSQAAPPLSRVMTTTCTRCVYSTTTMTTALVQHPPFSAAPFHAPSAEPASFAPYSSASEEVARICDIGTVGEQDMTLRKYHEALTESDSSCDSQPTIPEMVEDALEIISQDGDYNERISMDERMQCILCAWAGSKIVLEFHIRKEHASQTTQQDKSEWNITYKLGSLVNQEMWLSNVSERDGTMYVVSVKYNDPDCLMVSLTTLTSMSDPEPKMGTLTLYNKVSGEPYSWHGLIAELPVNMPYENDPNCLKVELSKLELLPNSANIRLHNRSLVLNSPSKVVVGQPELNDIHIIIFVKIHDLDLELP